MGREEVGKGTHNVPAFICWLTYLTALASIVVVFRYPPSNDRILTGFVAHIISTLIIFIFSFVFKNSSLYDPAWVYLAVGVCTGWFFTGNGLSTRGIFAFGLVLLWAFRFNFQFLWEGWFVGIKHEDWRYVDFERKTGTNTFLYWLVSLFGFHLVPTLLVFFAMTPVEKVWTVGK